MTDLDRRVGASSASRATELEELDDRWRAAAAAHWHPVARSADVRDVPVGVTLLGREYVVWRAPDGSVAVLDGTCVHRGTRLADGTVTGDGCLRCPYHGWEFGADGRCVRIPQLDGTPVPASTTQPSGHVTEHAGFVWANVSRSPTAFERPTVPELASSDWQIHVGPVVRWEAQASRHIENFCDVAHFSILHTASFGNPDVTSIAKYSVDRPKPSTLSFRYAYPGKDYLATDAPEGKHPAAVIDLDYEIHLPFSIVLRGINGPDTLIFTAVSPVDVTTCDLYWISARRGGSPLDGAAIDRAELAILEEDRLIVESQRPARLPLDPRAEVHLAFDRFAVAYRRALLKLGFPHVPVGLDGPPHPSSFPQGAPT